jgi:hypothetical protein
MSDVTSILTCPGTIYRASSGKCWITVDGASDYAAAAHQMADDLQLRDTRTILTSVVRATASRGAVIGSISATERALAAKEAETLSTMRGSRRRR